MTTRQALHQTTGTTGTWEVTCHNGTAYLLDLDRHLVLREPAGGRRFPWDGRWTRTRLVDDPSCQPRIHLGGRLRWYLTDTVFFLGGPIIRITRAGQHPHGSGDRQPATICWPLLT